MRVDAGSGGSHRESVPEERGTCRFFEPLRLYQPSWKYLVAFQLASRLSWIRTDLFAGDA
jgi:hypothetical protein